MRKQQHIKAMRTKLREYITLHLRLSQFDSEHRYKYYKITLTGGASRKLYLGPPDFKPFSADRSRRTDKPATCTSLMAL